MAQKIMSIKTQSINFFDCTEFWPIRGRDPAFTHSEAFFYNLKILILLLVLDKAFLFKPKYRLFIEGE